MIQKNVELKTTLADDEYLKIIYDWNRTERQFSSLTIKEYFEIQVVKTPHKAALVCNEVVLTYEELNNKANQLAIFIRKQYQSFYNTELIADTLILLCLERSIDMIIAILAVIKAGGAYVPIDLKYPEERISYILNDSKSPILLVQNDLVPRIKQILERKQQLEDEVEQKPLIFITVDEVNYKTEPKENLQLFNAVNDLAYVMYTSGTTGKPKGVMIEHASVINNIEHWFNVYDFGSDERVVLLSEYAFDPSVEQMYLALFSGGTLYVPTKEEKQDINILGQLIAKYDITHVHATPSILMLLSPFIAELNCRVISGAEACTKKLYKIFGTRLMNKYGMTESTVSCSQYFPQYDRQTDYDVLPIGKPMQNTRLYVLDTNLQPVGINQTGELYVSGVCLARGYLNKSKLTSEFFIDNPFALNGDKNNDFLRMYKSGDLVKWLPNGNLSYVGRNDFQVKIRGFRVELSEIKCVLEKFLDIHKVEIITYQHNESENDKQVAAYYTSARKIDEHELILHCAKSLPEYMIPTVYINLKEFPLTVNGKLDRNALPVPNFHTSQDSLVPATTPVEKQIKNIWCVVLNTKNLSIKDDFFKVGGDSIRALQLVSLLRKEGFNFSIKDIFSMRTIEKLSKNFDDQLNIKNTLSEQGILSGSFDMAFSQYYFIQNNKQKNTFHMFHIELPFLNKSRVDLILQKLIKYHDVLRISFPEGITSSAQKYNKSMSLPKISEIIIYHDDSINYDSIYDKIQNDIDVYNGPLWGAAYLLNESDEICQIVFVMHYLISDVMSFHIIAQDIKALYDGKALTKKGSSYRQWVNFLNGSIALLQNKNTINPSFDLGEESAHSLISNPNYSKFYQEFKIADFISFEVMQRALLAYNSTITDLLLVAVMYALKIVNDEKQHEIALEFDGRNITSDELDLSRTIGCFTSNIIIKLGLQDSLPATIKETKESIRIVTDNIKTGGELFNVIAENAKIFELPSASFYYLGQFERHSPDWKVFIRNIKPGSNNLYMPKYASFYFYFLDGQLECLVISTLSDDVCNHLVEGFKTHLKFIVTHCVGKVQAAQREYTPSDFLNVENEADLAHLPLLNVESTLYAPFPMTEIQKAYLLGRMADFEIGNVSTNTYREFVYDVHLDIEKLEECLNVLIKQYHELRIVFDVQNLTQSYLPCTEQTNYKIPVQLINEKYSTDTILKIRKRYSSYQYDPVKFPLFVFAVTRFYDRDVLHVGFDMILLDAESRVILFNVLTELYSNNNSIKNLTINFKSYQDYFQYLQYSRWYKVDKEYWRNKLKNLPLRPTLPMKNVPANIETPTFKTSKYTVFPEVWERFKKNISNNNLSFSSALLYLYGYVLSRYTEEPSFLITLTIFNRYNLHPDVNHILGDFTSTILFEYYRINKSIRDCMYEVHDALLANLNHALYSGVNVQRDLQHEHQLSQAQAVSPIIFTCRVNNKNEDHKTLKYFLAEHENIENRYSEGKTSQSWIDLQLYEDDKKFYSNWVYVEQLFDEKFIDHLNKQFCELITFLAKKNWKNYLPPIKLLPEEKALIRFANSAEQLNINDTIIDYCKRSFMIYNEDVAVIDVNNEYTYSQIESYSYNLGVALIANGAAENNLIAVFSEKGYQQVVATLAIMQIGAAYLPLNVAWPLGRINDVLSEGGVEYILVSNDCYQSYIKDSKIVNDYIWIIIENCIDDKNNILSGVSLPKITPQHIAYVIFTSGSTGKPKGVTISHGSVINTLIAMNDKYNIDCGSKVLALSDLSFDLSVYDIFGLLIAGGTIVFPEQSNSKKMMHWFEMVVQYQVAIWNTVPQLLQLFIDFLEDVNKTTPSLNLILLSGDKIPLALAKAARRKFPSARLVSLGGATEASIWSVGYDIENVDTNWSSIPYGVALPNQKLYVLNEISQHCGIGVVGEIFIGGMSLANGYWNDLKKTEDKFILHPKLGRIYKTGDLGRWHKDGYIEFQGRIDSQVKLNGYRIELNEISQRLESIKGIEESLVIIQDNYLVAYIITSEDAYQNISNENLRNQLGKILNQNLPDYMLPQYYIQLKAMPLTSNDKVDYTALPKAEIEKYYYQPPITKLEMALCKLWEEILDIKDIGVMDDFFSLGGTSVQAVFLSYKMTSDFDLNVSVADLFRLKTIKNIIHDSTVSLDSSKLFSGETSKWLAGDKAQQKIFFIHPGLAGCEVYQELAEKLTFEFCSVGIENYNIRAKVKIESLVDLAKKYIEIIKENFETSETIFLCGWSFGGQIALEMAYWLEQLGYNHIKVYVLDAMLPCEEDIELNNKIEAIRDAIESQLSSKLKSRGFDSIYMKKINALACLERQIRQQSITGFLRTTTVILFKANELDPRLPKEFMRDAKKLLTIPDNNIQKICKNIVKIYLVNCHHDNILEYFENNWQQCFSKDVGI